uniref:Uncharacterized protein n=1 Tax=Anguilla anguilla TaxID=7936 RepID=A0A0E9UIZ5_ANGAN
MCQPHDQNSTSCKQRNRDINDTLEHTHCNER